MDGYTDEPVRLRARIEITADGVAFDLTGSDPQRRAPVNSTYAQTFSACAYAVKCLIDPDLPVNDGFYRVVSLDAPEGTVTNCTWPSPVVGGWETQTRLVDVIFRALLPALPERLPAGTKAMMCHAGFGGVDAETNEYYCFLETFGGGYGGRFASDGPDAVQTHGQNTENAPVEETELNYPVRSRASRSSRTRTGRGASAAGSGCARTSSSTGRRRSPSSPTARSPVRRARSAVAPGRPAEYVLIRGGVETRLGAKTTVEARGGRHGQLPHLRRRRLRPAARSATASSCARDVREGRSASRARRETEYGMAAVDPISFEVIRNALVAATDEMALALKRSAYSTNIKTRSDFSCAFFDARAALGRAGLRAAGAPRLDGRAGAEGGAQRTAPRTSAAGDVLVTNDPHPSGVHLNDVSLISPVHHEGELIGYVANLAHHVDVGGGAPASIGAFQEVFQEGVIIPPVKLVAGGAIVKDVFKLILAQIRSKHETARRLPRPDRGERDRRAPRARRSSTATGARRSSRRWRSCSSTPSGARAPSSPRCRTASTRPRAPSTTTATPTSRSACRCASRSTPTASAST